MNAPGVAVGVGRGEGSVVGGWGVGYAVWDMRVWDMRVWDMQAREGEGKGKGVPLGVPTQEGGRAGKGQGCLPEGAPGVPAQEGGRAEKGQGCPPEGAPGVPAQEGQAGLEQASNSAILAHFRAHPFSRSQLKLPFLFEVAGVLECSGLSHKDSEVPGSLSSATPTLWELHGSAIPGFPGSMPKLRQSWEGRGLGPMAIPCSGHHRESKMTQRHLMWEKNPKWLGIGGKIFFLYPLLKYFFQPLNRHVCYR